MHGAACTASPGKKTKEDKMETKTKNELGRKLGVWAVIALGVGTTVG